MKRNIIALIALVFLSACNKDEGELWTGGEYVDEIPARIGTEINNAYFIVPPAFDSKSRAESNMSQFIQGNVLGLFGTSGCIDALYENNEDNKNIKSTYDGDNWNLEPKLILHYEPVTIYAYYPYDESVTDGTKIPFDCNKQIDYLWGTHKTGQTDINVDNPFVKLLMNHAMSQLEFNIKKEIIYSSVKVTKIEIRSTGNGTGIYTTGTYNCVSGVITPDEKFGNVIITDAGMDISYAFEEKNIRRMLVVPTEFKEDGDVSLVLTINGREHIYPFPAGTKWQQGQRNVYNITYQAGEINVEPVSINTWQDGGDIDLNQII